MDDLEFDDPELELAWMTDLLLSVRPSLDKDVIASILRRVKDLEADTNVIEFYDAPSPRDESVAGQLDKAISEAREDLNRIHAKRWNERMSIDDDAAGWNEYYTEHPEDAPYYELGSNGYAPAGSLSIPEARKDAVDYFFDDERKTLIEKQNRLVLLKHLILTRGGR